jgi:transaldolase
MKNIRINIFADGASLNEIFNLNKQKYISGFTTNPSLMLQENIKNYKKFAFKILKRIKHKPISFEVISDNFLEMEKQAREINTWSKNIFIKIPFTNSKGKKSLNLIKKLSNDGLKINVTSVFTYQQVKEVLKVLNKKYDNYISVFAGRIADTGINPSIILEKSVKICKKYNKIKILWASCREVYNIFEAQKIGCHIITVPYSIIKKFKLLGKNLNKYSIETSKEFYIASKKINF